MLNLQTEIDTERSEVKETRPEKTNKEEEKKSKPYTLICIKFTLYHAYNV